LDEMGPHLSEKMVEILQEAGVDDIQLLEGSKENDKNSKVFLLVSSNFRTKFRKLLLVTNMHSSLTIEKSI